MRTLALALTHQTVLFHRSEYRIELFVVLNPVYHRLKRLDGQESPVLAVCGEALRVAFDTDQPCLSRYRRHLTPLNPPSWNIHTLLDGLGSDVRGQV